MINLVFSLSLCTVLLMLYFFAFKVLPQERWQIFASIPVHKEDSGKWHGVNITYYGIITATGYCLAMAIFFLCLGSIGLSFSSVLLISCAIMLLFVPSARVVAYLVEGKRNTITVGGASFVMFIAAPWIVKLFNINGAYTCIDEVAFLTAIFIAYAFGEGFGRLACISFGCCYGRPINELNPFWKKIFTRLNFVFYGKTKKVSYQGNLEGEKVVPIQGITSLLYTITASLSLYFFLESQYIIAFFISLIITQLWRFVSEFLRADYRGNSKISFYQIMSLFIIPYFVVYVVLFKESISVRADIFLGFKFLFNPLLLMLLFVMWILCLMYTGISKVTASEIYVYVVEEEI